MSRDTDSSSATSTSEESVDMHIKRKSSKKHKRKSEKKSKKHKKERRPKKDDKKRPKRDSSSSQNTLTNTVRMKEAAIEESTFGPALPPHLLQKQTENKDEGIKQQLIGPMMPTSCNFQTEPEEEEEDSAAGIYGPMPVVSGGAGVQQMTASQLELEQRALELKLAAIEGGSMRVSDQTVREEWMLELPEVGLKTGLAALGNLKRTFHQGKERPDFKDRSAWTKTPQDAAQPQEVASTSKNAVELLRQEAQANYERQRDEEQERMARKHRKKHKREESLVELHQKKLRKEQRQKAKELAASGAKAERRPFSRDVDLKLNKIDSNQTKQIVDKAKILNTKFSSGHTKYL